MYASCDAGEPLSGVDDWDADNPPSIPTAGRLLELVTVHYHIYGPFPVSTAHVVVIFPSAGSISLRDTNLR